MFDPIENYMTGVLMPKPEEPPEPPEVQKKEEDLPRLEPKESLSKWPKSQMSTMKSFLGRYFLLCGLFFIMRRSESLSF